jgi:hypothetical protein
MSATIYIYLLDEGTDVWRPVSAEQISDEIYRITGSPPDDTETWQFFTGDTVRCREQTFASGERRLVLMRELHKMPPNKSPEPTAVGACRSAVAVHVASRRWLSFFR